MEKHENYVHCRIRKVEDDGCCNRLVLQFLDKLVGDVSRSMQIIAAVEIQTIKLQGMNVLESSKTVSTKRIATMSELSLGNKDFVAFQEMVREQCLLSIDQRFSHFSQFTVPILTQEQLNKMKKKIRNWASMRKSFQIYSIMNVNKEETETIILSCCTIVKLCII